MTNRVYDFTLAAAASSVQRFDVAGGFVKVLTAPGGVVGIKIDNGQEIACLAGQGFRLPDGQSFRDVIVRNISGVAQVGSIFIGDQRFEDSRVTGTVDVVDGAKARSILNTAGVGHINVPAVAANQSAGQLWNESTTQRLIVKQMLIGSTIAGLVGIYSHNATLASFSGTPPSKRIQDVGVGAGQLYLQNTTPAAPGTAMFYVRVIANHTLTVRLEEPYVIRPSLGLSAVHQTVNSDLAVTFEFFAEPNS